MITSRHFIKEIVKDALEEDIGKGDITTNAIVPKDARARAKIYARDNGVVAGLDIAAEVFRQIDKKVRIKKFVNDGAKVRKDQPLAEIKGKARALLTGERTALNFLQHLSGIATLTRKFVDTVKPCKVKILDTRKTIPGMRILEKYAVKVGGGQNHRMGLYDMVMVKDNHLRMMSSSFIVHRSSLKDIIKKMRKRIPKKMKIEIETSNISEVKEALEAGADIIMLDNMRLTMIKKAVSFITRCTMNDERCTRPVIEASGNVDLQNVKAIAKTGVDWISVGKLTHSAPALDISMEIQRG